MMQVEHVNSTGNSVQPAKAQASAAPAQASAAPAQTNTATDSVSKEIQSQIMNAQKKRQGLSFNMEMTAAEKEDIRPKIQQEISDLNRELRQREAEEKKKQQEAERAVEQKEERQEQAAQEVIRGPENTESTQDTRNGQPQESTVESNGREQTDVSVTDGEVRQILPGGMHKIISTGSAMRQFHIVRNTIAQNDSAARVQEAELNQDALRGADVNSLRKEQQESVHKETQRMDTVQKFIFGNSNNRATLPAVGAGSQFSVNSKENGLYNNNGTMFQNYFQSIQMDFIQ